MARNSRWDNPPRMNQNLDSHDSVKYSRYESDQRSYQRDHYNQRDAYEHHPPPPPRNQRESYEHPPQMRSNHYGHYNQDMPPRSTQEYPLPLTLPIPLAVPPSLEYEPV